MHILRLLWNLIEMYLAYRKNVRVRETGKGAAQLGDAMMKSFMKGDYQKAFFQAMDPFFKGYLMLQMGQTGAALPLAQFVVSNTKEPQPGALANNVLGQIYLEDKKYDQALECFRTSKILWQQRGGADRLIAELWLRRGQNTAEALESARRGIEKERAWEHPTADIRNSNLCEHLGTLAWAVAAESRGAAEVERLVSEGEGLTGELPVNSVAQMHLHFGNAYAALGRTTESDEHYEKAASLDPNGLAGRAAKAALAQPVRP